MPPDRQCQIEAHKIHRGKGLDVRLSLALASSTIQVKPPASLSSFPISRSLCQVISADPDKEKKMLEQRNSLSDLKTKRFRSAPSQVPRVEGAPPVSNSRAPPSGRD
ncbi:hypothetical protein TNCV_361141 [Trichonephila clavipes]|nr:hypothetical protein TNCV_361141 [Trichonephila clavipes]